MTVMLMAVKHRVKSKIISLFDKRCNARVQCCRSLGAAKMRERGGKRQRTRTRQEEGNGLNRAEALIPTTPLPR